METARAAKVVRTDVQRNRKALLRAAGELFNENGESPTMAEIARRSNLSLTTVYRHFRTIAEVNDAYVLDVLEEVLEFSESLQLRGPDRFEHIMRVWVTHVQNHGPALVVTRTPEGFLSRLARGDTLVGIIKRTWGTAISDLMRELDVDASLFAPALGLWNAMFDSREILDLLRTSQRGIDELSSDLTTIYRGTLQGLAVTRYP